MAETVLIAPADSPLGTALVEQATEQGLQVIAAVRPEEALSKKDTTGTDSNSEESARVLKLPWNRRSLLSARNLLLEGLNAFEDIEKAIILHIAEADAKPLHELPPVSIETVVDSRIKSPLFLIKALIQYYLRRKEGILAFALYEPASVPLTALAASASAGFKALVASLLGIYQNEDFTINGYTSHSEEPEGYATFILHSLTGRAKQTTGKWFRHNTNPLQALSRGRRQT